ncbi:hypothetical protein BV22DRAFT_1029783 [Leucogyrophana mollusca]|uniref:Uncharacterized protein n=1 Tax=Leucogyrophana mollusca TaxID=85980 RepID=A0ACB8BWE3_9AGAM|nr:hypothetical protein BV22DRAFT_1029783 [Leucogyrophana mollusca]
MFKTAATKLAHNSTIPALAGNHDLRPLQDLISAEKSVLLSLQKLSVDMTKASDALRTWGLGEGDDLGDTLSASASVLAHFSAALSSYATLEHTVRDNLKAVRTREENLDELRRRRKRVSANAESAEKKLNKMSPEHKNLTQQTDALNKLRDEIRSMDSEIMQEEADLGDFKRKCARNWMTLKFGGLVECCEKGVIAGDIGRSILLEIPEDITQPGLPRAFYNGHSKVNYLLSEAQQQVAQVTFSGNPSPRNGPGDGYSPQISNHAPPSLQATTSPYQNPQVTTPYLAAPQIGSGLGFGSFGSGITDPTSPTAVTTNPRSNSADELGVVSPTAETPRNANQFASLPATTRGVSLHDGPAPSSSSFSPSSNRASTSFTRNDNDVSFSSSIAEALSVRDPSTADELVRSSLDDPAPRYEPLAAPYGASPYGTSPHSAGSPTYGTSPAGPPPGAAPAAIPAWGQDQILEEEEGERRRISSEGEGSQLPYTATEDERESPRQSRHIKFDTAPSDEDEQSQPQSSVAPAEPYIPSPSTSEERKIPRIPPPSFDAEPPSTSQATWDEEEDDERARNAAAAREVSREMDALAFNGLQAQAQAQYQPQPGYPTQPQYEVQPPHNSQPQYQAQPQYQSHPQYQSQSPPSQYQQSPPSQPQYQSPQSQAHTSPPPSPLSPPNAPFSQRATSPRPPSQILSTSTSPRLPSSDLPRPQLSTLSPTGSAYRTPPEYPRPFSSPLMAKSTSSLNAAAPGAGAPRTISAAAFRRPQARTPSGNESGPADTSPLMLRKRGEGSPLPPPPPPPAHLERPVSGVGEDGEFDYISAYTTGEDEGQGLGPPQAPAGYGQGRFTTDLEGYR